MLKSQADPVTFKIPLLESIPGLACVFVGRDVEPRPRPDRLARILASACPGASPSTPVVTARQIHSDRSLLVGVETIGIAGDGDALLTTDRGISLGVATADCLPLAAVDPEAGVLALVHAGWRGTLAGVLGKTLRRMIDRLGADPGRIRIGTGAAVGVCCYEVGPEVLDAFRAGNPDHASRCFRRLESGAVHLDLIEANRIQALEAGIRKEHFAALGVCTLCRPDACHSYRRDGKDAGRMWLLASLLARATRPSS